jgi:predicted ester cyclase
MSSEEKLARRLIEEGFNQGDLGVTDEIVSADHVEHQYYGLDHAPGAEGVKAVIVSLRRAFSDFHLAIEDLVVDGDKVWVRMTATGTNDGSFMGHAPTERPMRTEVFDIVRVRDDLIVEHWGVPDRLNTLFQLGLAQPPSRPAARAASAAAGEMRGAA